VDTGVYLVFIFIFIFFVFGYVCYVELITLNLSASLSSPIVSYHILIEYVVMM